MCTCDPSFTTEGREGTTCVVRDFVRTFLVGNRVVETSLLRLETSFPWDHKIKDPYLFDGAPPTLHRGSGDYNPESKDPFP